MYAALFEGWFTRQLIFDGLLNGMVFGLVAMGIVLIYRSTRVINFAVANLGIIGAGLFALLVAQYNVPFWVAVPIAMIVGIAYGAIVELVVIRRLFTAPRVIVLVAANPQLPSTSVRTPSPYDSLSLTLATCRSRVAMNCRR